MKMMSFHIPEPLKARLDAFAGASGQGIASIVRKAIEQYLNRVEK
jgi:predicted DNA-binding protein